MSKIEYINQIEAKTSLSLPFFSFRVEAGFPSPADDFIEGKLDLNEHLVDSPSSTFYFRVSGDSMIGVGIFPNDMLIVDRSKTAKHNSIIVAVYEGGLIVKRLLMKNNRIVLQSENDDYAPIIISEAQPFEIWGVVTNAIRNFT